MEQCIKTMKDDMEKFGPTNSLLHRLIELNVDNIIETLRSQSEVPKHETYMSLLVSHATSESVSILARQGADLNSSNGLHETLLHHLCTTNLTDPIVTLLNLGAEINACDSCGQRPLHLAVRSNQLQTAKLLLKHGAWIDVLDRFDVAPLHYAVENECLQMVNLLISHGANVNVTNCLNPRMLLYPDRFRSECVKIMLKDKTGLDSKKNRDTALHLACERNNEEIVRVLLRNRAKVNVVGSLNQTPLHCAVMRGNLRIVKLLIRCGADVNRESLDGTMPLHLAIDHSHMKIIDALMEKGTKLKYTNRTGGSFLHYAIQGRKIVAVDRLLRNTMGEDWGQHWALTPLQLSLDGDEKIRDLILVHLIKLRSANFYIQDEDREFLLQVMMNTVKGRKLHERCLAELELMKGYYVSEFYKLTAYDILVNRRMDLTKYLCKDDVMSNVWKLKEKFPVYYHMLNKRIQATLKLARFLNKDFEVLQDILNRVMRLPSECILNIMKYIPERDIKRLSMEHLLRKFKLQLSCL